MSGVSFTDPSGLNLLMLLHQRLHAEGGRLAVDGLQPRPSRLLRITGADELIPVDTPAPNSAVQERCRIKPASACAWPAGA